MFCCLEFSGLRHNVQEIYKITKGAQMENKQVLREFTLTYRSKVELVKGFWWF